MRRRIADPGTGVLLSGGLDSSVVAALASHATGDRLLRPQEGGPGGSVHAYSATFPRIPEIDEASWIDQTTKYLGIPSTRAQVHGGSALRGAMAYLSLWQVPPTSPNLFFGHR